MPLFSRIKKWKEDKKKRGKKMKVNIKAKAEKTDIGLGIITLQRKQIMLVRD